MSEANNQPQGYCRNCGAEVRQGTQFCVSCGVRLISEPATSTNAHDVAASGSESGTGNWSLQDHPGSSEQHSAEYPRSIYAEYDLYKRFFQEAREGLEGLLNRWREREDAESTHREPSVSNHLSRALLHAQKGFNKTEEYKESFATTLLEDASQKKKALTLLTDLRKGQNDVITTLEDLYNELEAVEGYTEFKDEVARWYMQELGPYVHKSSEGEKRGPASFDPSSHIRDRNSSQPSREINLDQIGKSAQRFYEEASNRYRNWSEAQTAERERKTRRSRFDRYVGFFERAYGGSQDSLDWWQAYATEEANNEQPPISDLLRSARDRAETGLKRVRGMEESLSKLLQRDEFEKADRLLDEVRAGQENFDGEESVFPPLVAVHERIKRLEGWANYRLDLERFVKNLEDLLGSPAVKTSPANRVRFPDPDKPHAPYQGVPRSFVPDPASQGEWRSTPSFSPSTGEPFSEEGERVFERRAVLLVIAGLVGVVIVFGLFAVAGAFLLGGSNSGGSGPLGDVRPSSGVPRYEVVRVAPPAASSYGVETAIVTLKTNADSRQELERVVDDFGSQTRREGYDYFSVRLCSPRQFGVSGDPSDKCNRATATAVVSYSSDGYRATGVRAGSYTVS